MPGDDASTRLLGLLETGTQQLDALTRDSDMPLSHLLQHMLRLELAGMVEALQGGAYGRPRYCTEGRRKVAPITGVSKISREDGG